MSATSRPWWASPDATGALDDDDPVEAFRSARRGPEAGKPDADHPTGRDPGHDPGPLPGVDPGSEHGSDPSAAAGHRPELCGVCPLCTLARTLEETRPELLEHLTEAARHLAAAARVLLEPGAVGAPPPAEHRGVQHIDLDRDAPDATPTDPGGTP
ncbi:MAG: hypothetical protein ACLFV0_05105 [Nitriliruptoraceae bacterium]